MAPRVKPMASNGKTIAWIVHILLAQWQDAPLVQIAEMWNAKIKTTVDRSHKSCIQCKYPGPKKHWQNSFARIANFRLALAKIAVRDLRKNSVSAWGYELLLASGGLVMLGHAPSVS